VKHHKTCTCGKSFVPTPNQRYCSVECRVNHSLEQQREARRQIREQDPRPTLRCICGTQFVPLKGRQTFCSLVCRVRATIDRVASARASVSGRGAPQVPGKCPVCETEFVGYRQQKYCSPTCRKQAELDSEAEARRLVHSQMLPERECQECGKKFSPVTKRNWLCSAECRIAKQWRIERARELRKYERAASVDEVINALPSEARWRARHPEGDWD
jgi:hypothetical protein